MKKDEVGMFFRDVVMFYGLYKDSFQAPGKGLSPEVVNAVAHDPDGIGFVSFWYGQRLGLKALAIVDANGAVVEPTQENVASGRYPLVRPMYMYINRRPGEPLAPLVKEFLTFVLSREGQELINRTTSYLPLPAAIAAAERAKLE
jgi:phosphate transport system substrate-binding protein